MNSTILEIRKSAVLVFIALMAGVATAFGQSDTSCSSRQKTKRQYL